jgi:threonine synthase
MPFISTRGDDEPTSLRTAVGRGLAPDGGLYVPAGIAPLAASQVEALRGASLVDVGTAVARHLTGDEISERAWRALIADAVNFEVPLVPVEPDTWALELFHGQTLAFKDVGARVLARLFAHFQAFAGPVTVLVATSGDTGGAVAQAFAGVAGTRSVVLYPVGKVSPVQEAQFATIGGNVTALAVQGTFDDCQRLVKEAFANPAWCARWRLTSANSINIGRLLPQIFYFAHAALRLSAGAPVSVSVPSGNFGNLTAGLIARRLGFPLGRFVAATNVNDTMPRFLATGRYEPRPSRRTVANAMDVGDPSNAERIRWLFGDDLAQMREAMVGSVHDDEAVRRAMADLLAARGYLCDPHGAVAYLGLRALPARGEPRVFLATAHPAKFRDVVEPAIGRPVPLPEVLALALRLPNLARRIAARIEDLGAALETLDAVSG